MGDIMKSGKLRARHRSGAWVPAIVGLILATGMTVCCGQPARAADALPHIVCVNPAGDVKCTGRDVEWSFGDVVGTQGTTVAHTFVLENRAEKPVTLSRVTAGCGCTDITTSPDLPATLKAGERLSVKVTLALDLRQIGFVEKTVAVFGEGMQDPLMRISLHGAVVSPVVVSPSEIDFGRTRGAAVVRLVTVRRIGAPQTGISLTCADPQVLITRAAQNPGSSADVGITFRVAYRAEHETGVHSGRLSVNLEGADSKLAAYLAAKPIPYVVLAVGKISASPSVLVLDVGNGKGVTVILEAAESATLSHLRIECPAGVTASIGAPVRSPGTAKCKAKLLVTLNSPAGFVGGQCALLIHSPNEVLRIPLEAAFGPESVSPY